MVMTMRARCHGSSSRPFATPVAHAWMALQSAIAFFFRVPFIAHPVSRASDQWPNSSSEGLSHDL